MCYTKGLTKPNLNIKDGDSNMAKRQKHNIEHEPRCCSGSVSSACPASDTPRVAVERHEHHLIWNSCLIPRMYIHPC